VNREPLNEIEQLSTPPVIPSVCEESLSSVPFPAPYGRNICNSMATPISIAMHARLFTKSNAERLHRKGKALQRGCRKTNQKE